MVSFFLYSLVSRASLQSLHTLCLLVLTRPSSSTTRATYSTPAPWSSPGFPMMHSAVSNHQLLRQLTTPRPRLELALVTTMTRPLPSASRKTLSRSRQKRMIMVKRQTRIWMSLMTWINGYERKYYKFACRLLRIPFPLRFLFAAYFKHLGSMSVAFWEG